MKISTKGRYAVRLMIDMATNDGAEPVKVKDIAARQGLSEKYLEQIISALNKGGIVKSIRGAGGGYQMARPATDITVGEVLRITEGSLSPVACMDQELEACNRCDTCESLGVWKDLADAINNVVDNVTIADLVEKQTRESDECKA